MINTRYFGFFAEDCFRFTWVLYNCLHILHLLCKRLVLFSSARLVQSGCQSFVQCLALDKILSFHILWVKDNNFRLYLYLALSSLVLQTTECSLCAPDHHIAFSLLHPLLWIMFLVISIFMSIPSLSFEAYSKAINIELEVKTNYCKEAGIWILKVPFNTQSSQHCDCIFFFIYYSYCTLHIGWFSHYVHHTYTEYRE